MDLNNFFFYLFLISFAYIFNKYSPSILRNFNPNLLVDNQFEKPQAFHKESTSLLGGTSILLSLLVIYLYSFLYNNIFYLEYLSFSLVFFFLGFNEDLKINFNPKIRLLFMILLLIFLIIYNEIYIYKTGITFLNDWLISSKFFLLFFVCLCFLFIVNGANLVDGFNGLFTIHTIIILANLFLINFFSGNIYLANLLLNIILVLLIFLNFNFPKAKIFLGDGGSYLLGAIISLSIIKTSIANPEISPFYFCILLFYLFFEVFFSFVRKLFIEKKSPLYPDKNHLHMKLYKILLIKNNDMLKSNYQTSIIINFIYLAAIIPVSFMKNDGMFCKYYSLVFFIIYIFSYKIIT